MLDDAIGRSTLVQLQRVPKAYICSESLHHSSSRYQLMDDERDSFNEAKRVQHIHFVPTSLKCTLLIAIYSCVISSYLCASCRQRWYQLLAGLHPFIHSPTPLTFLVREFESPFIFKILICSPSAVTVATETTWYRQHANYHK